MISSNEPISLSITAAELTPSAARALPLGLQATAARAQSYAAQSRASNTRHAYAKDLRTFVAWCSLRGLVALPASSELVALYIADLAERGRRVSTIARALTAINQAHLRAGLQAPRACARLREVWAGIRRTLGTAPRQKAPLLVESLRAVVAPLPQSLAGCRNRALLVLGWALGARRSELVALDVEDLRETRDGLEVTIRRSKTDQEGAGRKVGVPYGSTPATCPVRTVRAWLDASGIRSGALFRGVRHGRLTPHRLDGRDVARILQRSAAAVGLDGEDLAGHSLRAGFATTAARAGKSERSIMAQTGHRSILQVRRYIRNAEIFTDNAAQGIGL